MEVNLRDCDACNLVRSVEESYVMCTLHAATCTWQSSLGWLGCKIYIFKENK